MRRHSELAIVLTGALVTACDGLLTGDKCDMPARNDKERNVCTVDTDCQYFWFTGGCYTPEYVARTEERARCEGTYIGEATPRQGVTCTCEKNACVTHNCYKTPANDKERDICATDADCEYTLPYDGCHVPEYSAKMFSEASCDGRYISLAPHREGVTCTCEKSACVTHN